MQPAATRNKTAPNHGRRLVVVSNRTASSDEPRAGGLAVALSEALRERGGLWFGWSGRVSDTGAEATRVLADGATHLAVTDLTSAEYECYYRGFANGALWPLLHYRTDLVRADLVAFESYEGVNRRFARQIAALLRPSDVVWVHDYHLIPLGRELRAAGWQGATGFLLHVPFPAPEIFSTLPQHARLARALLEYDLVGFQTEQDADNFRLYLSSRRRMTRVAAVLRRQPLIGAFPSGIDPGEIDGMLRTRAAREAEDRIRRAMPGQALAIGADRMDYSKGLPQRLRAFERLLVTRPALRRRIGLVQIASPSRSDLEPHVEIAAETERIAARINGAFGDLSWTPVRHLSRCYPRDVLAGLFRAARVGLMTPLRDGMNLVAKEFVTAQDPVDPGVLVLSRFSGAAMQLDAGLLVNPHDADELVAAIDRALAMPRHERIRRWQALDAVVRAEDVGWWCRSYLEALAHARPGALPRRHVVGLAATG